MAKYTKVPCGGFKIGNGLRTNYGGKETIESAVVILYVQVDGENAQIIKSESDVSTYWEALEVMERNYLMVRVSVGGETESLICTEPTLKGIGILFDAIGFDTTNDTMTVRHFTLGVDNTVSFTTKTYKLTANS